jgi:hypothetical protein
MNPDKRSKRKLFTLLILIFVALSACQSMQQGQLTPAHTMEILPTGTLFPSFIVHIPDKALWKNYLNVSVESPTGTPCRLTYVPPMGTTQEMDTTADENGLCSWRWKISEEEGKGPGRLIFTIDGHSETHFIEIRRSF